MRLSRAPVIASHSGVAGVFVHPRNMDDEMLRALRDDGGVIQVVAYDEYLKLRPDEEVAALRELKGQRRSDRAWRLRRADTRAARALG